jgi:class 3 adenylate cyclase
MAMGDLQTMSLRPFGRAHMGAIGDCINMAARLCSVAGPSEVVVSNTFFQQLALPAQARFTELEPVDARNVGRIRAWKLRLQDVARLEVDLTRA